MEPVNPDAGLNTQKRKQSFIRRYLPFGSVLLGTLLTAAILFMLISAKKVEVDAKQSAQASGESTLTNVITMEILPGMVREKINLPGVAKPWISLDVVAEVRGKIITKPAGEGSRVEKGDVIAVIDKADYQNSFDAAYASWEIALSTQKRMKALVKRNFATQSQLDDAIAAVKTSKAKLENAKLDLSRCTIRSPMKGIVDRVHIENGTFLNPGDPVGRILQIDRLKVEVGIPESDVDAVRNLSSFEITIDALDGAAYTGSYHYLYNTADSMARLYTLEIEVENQDHRLLPDMFARVEIVKHQDPQGLAVPMYALVTKSKSTGVFVENEGVVRFRPVKKGFQDGWDTQITKGLEPGDKVVVVGHRLVEDSQRVNVTRTVRNMEEIYQ